jgi:hypothetical protein
MKPINIPGFTAEQSLATSNNHYLQNVTNRQLSSGIQPAFRFCFPRCRPSDPWWCYLTQKCIDIPIIIPTFPPIINPPDPDPWRGGPVVGSISVGG